MRKHIYRGSKIVSRWVGIAGKPGTNLFLGHWPDYLWMLHGKLIAPPTPCFIILHCELIISGALRERNLGASLRVCSSKALVCVCQMSLGIFPAETAQSWVPDEPQTTGRVVRPL